MMESFRFPIFRGLWTPEAIMWKLVLEEASSLTINQISKALSLARKGSDRPDNPVIGYLSGDEIRLMIVADNLAKSAQSAIDNSDDVQGKIIVENLSNTLCRLVKHAVIQHWLKNNPEVIVSPGYNISVCDTWEVMMHRVHYVG